MDYRDNIGGGGTGDHLFCFARNICRSHYSVHYRWRVGIQQYRFREGVFKRENRKSDLCDYYTAGFLVWR